MLASLLVARLLTPMMAVWLLQAVAAHGVSRRSCDELVSPGSVRDLSQRRRTVVLATLFLVGSLALVLLLPAGFIPASDRGFTTVNVELPPGSSLDDTLTVAWKKRAGECARWKACDKCSPQSVSPVKARAILRRAKCDEGHCS